MPDVLQGVLFALIALATATAVGWPLLRGVSTAPAEAPNPEAEARGLRHRVALEGLLDVEADRRAGSLDDASYARERAEAEERAAETLTGQLAPTVPPTPVVTPRDERRAAAWIGAGLAVALLVGFALPGANGLGERTVVNQALAEQLAREADRQAEIQRLLTALSADPQDPQVLSDLADAYLAGSSSEDLKRAAVALQVLLAVQPQNTSAYRRLVTAYISAQDWTDAQAATDSYAAVAGDDEPDIPFFMGLIAFRQGDAAAAVRHFDRFLELAPNDPRATMVSSLRAEAAGELPGSSAPPGG
jgi:cytochrome c-type biogenesis protein CcmH/NrfG